MKSIALLLFLLIADFSLGSPLFNKDQDEAEPMKNIPQEVSVEESKHHRWSLIPDSEGNMHLVDLNFYETPIEPLFVPETDMNFLLLTRRNPTVTQRITSDQASLDNSNFNPSHPTRFTIHGWQGGVSSAVNLRVAEAYFQHGEYNMVTVDWTIGAAPNNYLTARNRVGTTASHLASLIDFLHSINYVRFPEVHVIGHSLGAQVAGLTGKAVTRGTLQVVMALDPAGPLFSLDEPDQRVAPTDAVHVEIIHTNAGLLGFREPIGHASFYPNFGRTQPGCGVDLSGQCAHARSTLFYAESINNVFTAQECESFEQINNNECTTTGKTTTMGGPIGNIGIRGVFFFTTNGESPFSQG